MAPTKTSRDKEPVKKARLKTSEEVYAYIRTDFRFDPRLCSLVYLDKLDGVQEMKRCAVSDWVPISQGGDIPFHRVYFIEMRGQVFWDRSARMYDQALLLRLAAGGGVPPFANLHQAADLPTALPASFTIASLNVLFDLYDHRITRLEPRLPRISEVLEGLQADVIMLQECTPKVLVYLQQQEWVMRSYAMAHTNLEPYGQITLARCRINDEGNEGAAEEALTEHKKVLRVTLPVVRPAGAGNGGQAGAQQGEVQGSVDIWNIHFPTCAAHEEADRDECQGGSATGSASVPMSRARQMQRVEQLAQARYAEGIVSAVVVGGDYNAQGHGDQGMGPFMQHNGWQDVWVAWQLQQNAATLQQQREDDVHSDAGTDGGSGASSSSASASGASSAVPGGAVSQQSPAGYTYDPRVNALARQLSSSQQPARFDRLLCLGAMLKVQDVQLWGQQASPPLSDHWGLRCTLEAAPLPATEPQGTQETEEAETNEAKDAATGCDWHGCHAATDLTVKTALTWIPPMQDWVPIQAMRSSHDPKYGRIPPHIHVMCPFIQPSSFAQFAAKASAPDAQRSLCSLPGETEHTCTHGMTSSSSSSSRDFGSDATVLGLVHGASATVALQPNRHTCQKLQRLHTWASELAEAPLPTRPYQPHLSLARIRVARSAAGGGPAEGRQHHAGSMMPMPVPTAGTSITPSGSASTPAFTDSDHSAAAKQYRGLLQSAAALLPRASGWQVERLCIISREEEDAAGFVVKRIISLPGTAPVSAQQALEALCTGLPHMHFCAVGSHLLLPTLQSPWQAGGEQAQRLQEGSDLATSAAADRTSERRSTNDGITSLAPKAHGKSDAEGGAGAASSGSGEVHHGDLDVLAACTAPPAETLAAIKAWMQTCGLFYNVYQVSNEHLTFLRGWAAGGLELDVHAVQWPPPLQPHIRCLAATPWDVLTAAELVGIMAAVPEAQATALSMVAEPRRLMQGFQAMNQGPRYQRCLAAVRAWARAAGVYGQSYGYPGGMVWAVVTAVGLEQVIKAEQAHARARTQAQELLSDPCPPAVAHHVTQDCAAVLHQLSKPGFWSGSLAAFGGHRSHHPGAAHAAAVNAAVQACSAALSRQSVMRGWWQAEEDGGLAPRWHNMPKARLATLSGSNAAHRLLPSTLALTKVALLAGAQQGVAAQAVATAKLQLPHSFTLHLRAEDIDDARQSICWLLRPLHRLLAFMDRECVAVAPDSDWTPACACTEGPAPGVPEATIMWRMRYLRDCTRLHVVLAELLDRFHQENKRVALWHEQS